MHVARRLLVAVVAFGTVVSLAPGALAGGPETLVENGGFEKPEVTGAFQEKTGTEIPGWTITGCVDLVADPAFDAARGHQSLDLNGSVHTGTTPCAANAKGSIKQTIDTDANQDYILRFFLAGNPGCMETDKVKVLDVYWGGVLVATFRYDTTGQSPTNIDWQLRVLELRAKAGSTVLEFKSANPGNCGPMIDAVRVRAAA
jgi:Protein of unknown function (DUF642)